MRNRLAGEEEICLKIREQTTELNKKVKLGEDNRDELFRDCSTFEYNLAKRKDEEL